MNFSRKIYALISEIEGELGADAAFPITIELTKAYSAAQKLEALLRCDKEIANCLNCQATATAPEQRLGAFMGELDWLSERERLMEEKA